MDREALQKRILPIITPLIEEECLELVELKARRGSDGMHVVILVDTPQTGVSIEACAVLNKRIAEALEGHEVFAGPYTLEVSSPGLDRNLSTAADFRRCAGRRVHLFLSEPVEDRIEWVGVVRAADERSVTIEAAQRMVSIDLEKIRKARQEL